MATLRLSRSRERTDSGRTIIDHERCTRLVVILIRPSKYDDEGYVIRHFRGTLPSNTLSCLNSLTEDAVRQGALRDLEVRVHVIDEIVSRVDPRRLGRTYRRGDTKVVVGLVGVQTNQFPRAQDLARQFKAEGFDVMIGGFHVSGSVAMSPDVPPECQAMLNEGVTLVLGEVEDRWAGLLRDAAAGRLQPLYNFLDSPPRLDDKPLPRASAATQRKFAVTRSGTIDAGRGCPFNCSFCTIINVQGRRMRARSPERILAQIRENFRLEGREGVSHYFFTDDNFTRNQHWEAIFDGLIQMREAEGIEIDFMMQVDTQAPKIPNFIEKAARAGCMQVFIGMETIRDDNLKAGGKPQNKSAEYREMIARWHAVGVVCHVGYIIGFPHDTYERVMEDVRTLRETLLVDQASFFMLTPIPGSRDHRVAVRAGVPLDPDYNNFDSFHATMPHAKMSADEWRRAFRDAWREFYSFEQMRRSLLRQNPHTYWAVLKNMIWYRAGMAEGAHPMITGFFRLKDRLSRRPGFPIESRWTFFKRRLRETTRLLREYLKIALEMQELWLMTRIRREDYAFLGDLRKLALESMQEAKINWGRVHTAMDERVSALSGSVGAQAHLVGTTMAERLEAVREALGSRATALGSEVGHRAGVVRASLELPLGQIRGNLHARRRILQAALGDLRMKYLPHLPAAKRRSGFRRAAAGLTVFSHGRPYARRDHVKEYWQRTWHTVRRVELWRLNPFALSWRLVRDCCDAARFFVAMHFERY
ncbi:MAG: radical SAM protein [Acidobacteria bacterium]|nr:radical SAM protein [Acidobacteriota bacterium]